MIHTNFKKMRAVALTVSAALLLALGTAVTLSAQQSFASPDEAVKALSRAVKSKDHKSLAEVFGPRIRDFVSGDAVADAADLDEFAANLSTSTKFEKVTDQKLTLLLGEQEWPFAAPIIKVGERWGFDTDAGVEEMLNRRIGRNESSAIDLCQVYAEAQYEYFDGGDWDGDQVSEYAQKISSSAGKHDGLYWEKLSADEEESPLGSLFANAAIEGYKANKATNRSVEPFHGYYFKILFRQGVSAPGGKYNYIINGHMIAGFALVAYPATWGNSGVMTFIVNQEGRVYQKNLGPRTKAIAEAMTEYDPDVSWSLVDVE